jgi:hypothetical protein
VLRILALLAARLPPGWNLNAAEEGGDADSRIDAVVELVGPGEEKAVLVFEAKSSVVNRDLPAVLSKLRSHLSNMHEPAVPVVAARYLSSSAQAWLEERGVGYADATGNMRIAIQRPAVFLRDTGADHDPWRGRGRPRSSLIGPPAARVVRALIDYTPPVTVRELVRRSGASVGATYRAVEFLENEGLLERVPGGAVERVDWRRLLERWSRDYGFQRCNAVTAFLHPRGLDVLQKELASSHGTRYAITGSLAAQRLAPYAPVRLAMIYVDDPWRLAEQVGLRDVPSGANVLLAATDYHVVYERLVESGGLKYTAPSQTAVDLLTAPGRGPAEGLALLEWMEEHERDWRL